MYVKKLISFLLSFLLIFENMVIAASQPVQQDRTLDQIRELLSGATPSNLPVAGVTQSARDETALLIKKQNLSAHGGKNVFVGYGVYDIEEKNCKYVEKPGLTKTDYLNAFYKRAQFAQHAYGVSRYKMTYGACKALATQLGGHVVVPDTIGEKNFLYSSFVSGYINSDKIGTIWTGIYRQSCSDSSFYNELFTRQEYLPFKNDYEKMTCDNSKLYTVLESNGKIRYASPYENYYCVVEFESRNMFRPIKICAPWWRIIRTYKKLPTDLPYDTRFLNSINQADIPVNMTVCTKYDEQGVSQIANADDAARLVQCTTYYSRKKGSECIDKPLQDQCFVNECKGYIENACELKKEKTTGKGYVKGEIIKDGKLVETKVHLQVKTREYLCPPSPVSKKHCLELSTVLIYPKECPSSNCESRKECIAQAFQGQNTEEELNAKIDACEEQFKCVKIYADRSLPLQVEDIDPSTGEVLRLRGRCPYPDQNVILTFPVNKQDTHKKVCVEYEERTVTQLVKQKCVIDRPFEEKIVDMSITQTDPYEGNPNCIRVDDVRDSQPVININVEVDSPGYMQHKARVIHLDKTEDTIINTGSSEFVMDVARYPYVWHKETYFKFSYTEDTNTSYGEMYKDAERQCSPFGESDIKDLLERTFDIFFDGSEDNLVLDPNIGRISRKKVGWHEEDPYNLYVELKDPVTLGIDTPEKCRQYAKDHGFEKWIQNDIMWWTISGEASTGSFACGYSLKKMPQDDMIDIISPISESSPAGNITRIKYVFNQNFRLNMRNGQKDPQGCKMAAFCMDGVMESSDPCTIVQGGEGSPESYVKDLGLETEATKETFEIPEVDIDSICKPGKYTASAGGNFDAIKSIVVFEDYLDGGFGYYSNYNTFPIKSNEVYINVNDHKWKLPMEKMRTILDRSHFHLWNDHVSSRKKKPNVGLLFLGGAVTGAVHYIGGIWAAAITGVVVIILIILLTKPKKMDRQMTENFIYKDIPRDYYLFNAYNRYEIRLTPQQDAVIQTKPFQGSSRTFSYILDKGANAIVAHPNFIRRIYLHSATDTGRDRPDKFKKRLENILNHKLNLLRCLGFSNGEINRFIHPDERTINYGYPKCPLLNPWCERSHYHLTEYTTNTAGQEEAAKTTKMYPVLNDAKNITDKTRIGKEVGTVYLGADNNVMILVPFAGDYRIEAYNKYDELLASRIIHESSFTKGEESNGLLYAQVNFAATMNILQSGEVPEEKTMNLAPGLTYGLRDHACLQDRMVEWGGGVSGVFFESQRTDESKNCQKSNDAYVYDQSATKLFVQPLNMEDGGFEFNLTKPLPFPNRVWIATLNMKQKRRYICYKDFPVCGGAAYKNMEAEQ